MLHVRSRSFRPSPVMRPYSQFLCRFQLAFTWSLVWRLGLSFLMSATFVLGMWIGIVSPAFATAYAASIAS